MYILVPDTHTHKTTLVKLQMEVCVRMWLGAIATEFILYFHSSPCVCHHGESSMIYCSLIWIGGGGVRENTRVGNVPRNWQSVYPSEYPLGVPDRPRVFCQRERSLGIWGLNLLSLRIKPFYFVVLWPQGAAVNIIPPISEIPGMPANQMIELWGLKD